MSRSLRHLTERRRDAAAAFTQWSRLFPGSPDRLSMKLHFSELPAERSPRPTFPLGPRVGIAATRHLWCETACVATARANWKEFSQATSIFFERVSRERVRLSGTTRRPRRAFNGLPAD